MKIVSRRDGGQNQIEGDPEQEESAGSFPRLRFGGVEGNTECCVAKTHQRTGVRMFEEHRMKQLWIPVALLKQSFPWLLAYGRPRNRLAIFLLAALGQDSWHEVDTQLRLVKLMIKVRVPAWHRVRCGEIRGSHKVC